MRRIGHRQSCTQRRVSNTGSESGDPFGYEAAPLVPAGDATGAVGSGRRTPCSAPDESPDGQLGRGRAALGEPEERTEVPGPGKARHEEAGEAGLKGVIE
jgi:hypothetical protein